LTPLHYAASNGHLSVVEYLVNKKAKTNEKDQYGRTPLRLANDTRKDDVAKFLKEHGDGGDCRI